MVAAHLTARKPSSLGTGLTLKYDAWNRLVEVKQGETLRAKHEYDGLNRRTIEAPTPSATTYYIHQFYNSSWQMLEMRTTTTENAQPESVGVGEQYVWSARYIDALVLRGLSATRYYYLGDANFNVTTLVDTAGDAREHYQYDPYGVVKVLNGAAADTDGAEWTDDPNYTDVSNHHLYTGRYQDYTTGLYHYRNRYYHAELGRFISRDPIGYEAGDANLYRYVGNCPNGRLDPNGLDVSFGPIPIGSAAVRFTVAKGALLWNLATGWWSNPPLCGTGSITSTGPSVSSMVAVSGDFCCNGISGSFDGNSATILAELQAWYPGEYQVKFSWSMLVTAGSAGKANATTWVDNGVLSTGSRESLISAAWAWGVATASGTGTAKVKITTAFGKGRIFIYTPAVATPRGVAVPATAMAAAKGKFTITSVCGPVFFW